MPFTIRPATPEDCTDIAKLVHALASFEKLADEAVGTPEDFRAHLFAASPAAYASVAEIDGDIVGLAIWFYSFNTFTCRRGLYVEDVFVQEDHRGQGIGRAFFRNMAQAAMQTGCSRMEWSVLDWNAAAIGFYRSMGAIGMDGWTVQRLGAELIAQLALGDTHG